MPKPSDNSPAFSNWPDWRKYILPAQISDKDKRLFKVKIENGDRLTRNDFCTVIYQEVISDKTIYILQSLGYITDQNDLNNKTDVDKDLLLDKIEILIHKSYQANRNHLDYLLKTGQIKKTQYNKKMSEIKQDFSNIESVAGGFLYSICGLFGQIVDFVDEGEIDPFYLYDSIYMINMINDAFYKFKTMVPSHIGSIKTNQVKQERIFIVYKILEENNIRRPSKKTDSLNYIESQVKQLYKQKTGKSYPYKDKTLENTIEDYFNQPGK